MCEGDGVFGDCLSISTLFLVYILKFMCEGDGVFRDCLSIFIDLSMVYKIKVLSVYFY